jgi:hypothetical protein
MSGRADLNAYFDEGAYEILRQAQKDANNSGKSIRVGGRWVNPSSASLARRSTPRKLKD